jgi:hypothetical protein
MKTLSDYEKLLNIQFTQSQIDQIRAGYDKGLTDEQVSTYAKPEIPTLVMMEKIKELLINE